MLRLRDYQRKAHTAILEQWKSQASTLLVLPTGCGKTVVFAHVIKSVFPRRCLVLAHRSELIHQAADKIHRVTGYRCDIEMGEQRADLGADLFNQAQVVVSTVQTQNAGADGSGRMTRFDPSMFGVIVIDEGHHGVGDSYKRVIDYYRAGNPSVKILGVTATPDRADEEALGQVYESVALDYEILNAIEDGWLVPIQQQMIEVAGLDFSGMRTTAGDLNGADLARVMEEERNLHEMATPAIEIVGNRRAIVFTASVNQAERMCDILNRHKEGCAAWVCGKTDKEERRKMLAAFSKGAIQYVVNCGVLTEGFDDAGVEVVVMGRPTKSRSLYAQMCGRATRPLTGLVDPFETPEERRAAIAGSSKKCIAQGQRVLTDCGLVPIECVTNRMKVWDGLDFVTNAGVVFRGIRKVIEYAGLTATSDHEVLSYDKASAETVSQMWKTFGQCAAEQAAIVVAGIGGKEIRETDNRYRRGTEESAATHDTLSAYGVRLREAIQQRVHEFDNGTGRLSDMWTTSPFSEMALHEMPRGQGPVQQAVQSSIQALWWAWHKILFQLAFRHGNLDTGKYWDSQRHVSGPYRQRRELRGGQFAVGKPATAMQQSNPHKDYASTSCVQNCKSWLRLFRLPPCETDTTRFDVEGNTGTQKSEGTLQREFPVFDIVNAGPRHRFTCEGLIVSNCMTVLDFVGNSGRHKLMTSADILGGNVSDEAIELATRKAREAGAPVDMAKSLEDAEKEVALAKAKEAARRAGLKARAQWAAKNVDPFDVFQISPPKARGWDAGRVLSEKQRALLQKQGIDPDAVGYAGGKQLLNAIFERWQKGLCSFRQAKCLRKYGYTGNETRAEALAILDAKFGKKKEVVSEPF